MGEDSQQGLDDFTTSGNTQSEIERTVDGPVIPGDYPGTSTTQNNANAIPPAKGQKHKFDRIKGLQTWRRALIFSGLTIGLFLSLMDTSIITTALLDIALDFGSLGDATWAILSYQLAYLGFSVIFPRLSDFIGRREAVLLACALFVAFSLGAGWAQTIDQLIVFRALQGIGGAGLYSLALVLLIELSTQRLVVLTSAIMGAIVAISGILGPIVGGLLAEYVSWRWIFWLNGPCMLAATVCLVVGWPKGAHVFYERHRWTTFDFIGGFLTIAASVNVVFSLQEAGQGAYAWNSAVVLSTLIVGSVCWLLLLSWEYYVSRDKGLVSSIAPMFPFRLITNRPMLAGIISTTLTGFAFFLVLVSLPLRFQIVNLKSPAAAGIRLLPLLCSSGLGSFIGGAVSRGKNRLYPTFVGASCLILLGSGLLSTLDSSATVAARCYGFQVIVGAGVGLTFSSISMLTALEAAYDDHAVAQGIVSQARLFGGSIGIAASNAMFRTTSESSLKDVLTPQQIQELQTNTGILNTLSAANQEAVRVAYARSFQRSLRACTYIAAACVVVSAFIWQSLPTTVAMESQPAAELESASNDRKNGE